MVVVQSYTDLTLDRLRREEERIRAELEDGTIDMHRLTWAYWQETIRAVSVPPYDALDKQHPLLPGTPRDGVDLAWWMDNVWPQAKIPKPKQTLGNVSTEGFHKFLARR